ncbi:hypothetical protein GCM10009716_48720 [Streptomyces sodiiphilus]|uniref:Uncharacterized protein n=1 Tax=Streptomyces sodiiphilus TaxID=226217 RepID=A0ABN2PZK3_9ACTN
MGLLSWLGGRRRSDAAGTGGGEARSAAGDGDAVPRRPREGWREVPPLQRTVEPPVPVTDPEAFAGSLGTWRDASLLGPMGHLVSEEAPSGMLHGIAEPTPGGAAEAGREPGPGTAETAGPAGPAPVPVQRVVGTGPLVSAPPPELPPQRLAPLVAGAEPPDAVVRPDPPAAPGAAGPERAQSGPDAVPGAAPPVQRSGPEPAPRPRAFGLGAPLPGLPPTAQRTPAGHAPSPTAPDARPGRAPGQTGPEGNEGAGPPPVPAVTEGSAAQDAGPSGQELMRPLLGEEPPVVSRAPEAGADVSPGGLSERASGPAGGGEAPGPDSPGGGSGPADRQPVPLQRATADGKLIDEAGGPAPAAEGHMVPLTAQRAVPLFSGELPPGVPGGADTGEGAVPVVPVRWAGEEGSGGTAGEGGGGGAGPGSVPLQRQTDDPTGAVPGSGPSMPAPASPGVARPSVPPVAGAGTARGTGGLPDAGSAAIAAGVAQRSADGSVVFGAPRGAPGTVPGPPPSPPPEPTAVAVPTAVQRYDGGDVGDAGEDILPGELLDAGPDEDPPDAPLPEPGPDAAAPEDEGGERPGPAGAGGKAGAPEVSDELVRALYPPLSRMLRAELRLERERAGFLINTRH